jgi:hypothetical protein
MLTAEFTHEEIAMMTQTGPQLASQNSVSRAAAMMAAIMLILIGIVFQWGQLGNGQSNTDGFWVIRMIAVNVWDLVSMHLGAPGLEGILKFWPLMVVAFGLAILLALKPGGRAGENGTARKGENTSA